MAITDSSADSGQLERADSLVLFRRANRGDSKACEAFFDRYSGRVRKMAHVRLGPRMRGLVESSDVAQDALIEAVEDLGELQIQGRSHLRRLFARLVQHRISALARYFRADRRDRGREQPLDARRSDDGNTDLFEPALDAPGPLDALEANEGVMLLGSCIDELSPDHREVVRMRLLRRLSWEEVAKELGRTTPDAARMLHRRAMLELRRIMRQRLRMDAD